MASVEEVTIREFKPGDGPGIVQLLNDVFAEGDADYEPRTQEQWSWVYEQNPAGHEIIVAENPDGRIVGHYACIPYRVTIDGREAQCGQGVDSMVAVDYRRGLKSEGLFLRTARRYFDTFGVPAHNAYGYGFPNARAFRIGVRLLKYVPIHAPVTTLGRNLFEKSAASDAEVGRDADQGSVVEPIVRFQGEADELWGKLAPEIRMGTVRDDRFLNWRYIDCPFADYRAFGLRGADGAMRGLYISRADWTGPPILALSEFLVPGEDVGATARLLAHAVAEARSTGQQRVEFWMPPGHPHFAAAKARGFVAEPSPFNLCIKMYEAGLQPDWVRSNWYFGTGDTDVF